MVRPVAADLKRAEADGAPSKRPRVAGCRVPGGVVNAWATTRRPQPPQRTWVDRSEVVAAGTGGGVGERADVTRDLGGIGRVRTEVRVRD